MLDLLHTGPAVTWAASGELPPDHRRVEQLAVLPSAPGRSFLISLAARRGAASALTSYNALRPVRKRAVRSALALTLSSGLGATALRERVDIGVSPQYDRGEPQRSGLLTHHLSDLLGVASVVIAYSAGNGPYRKPVLQVFSSTGVPLGYIKVGWNDWTREGVRREASALRACSGQAIELGVPALIGLSSWQGLDLLVTAPLPRQVKGVRAAAPLPPVTALREIAGLAPQTESPLAGSSWWKGVRSRISTQVSEPSARAALNRIAAVVEQDYGRVSLPFGFCHGDLVPWNLATQRGRLYAWDWESSIESAPLGFDAVHYYFQIAFVGQGQPVQAATTLAASQALPALRELGVPASGSALISMLHLMELFLRHEHARSAAGAADERFFPAVISVLDQQLARTRAAVPSAVGRVA